MSKNLGDPGLFLGTAKLEEELVKEIGELFGGKILLELSLRGDLKQI